MASALGLRAAGRGSAAGFHHPTSTCSTYATPWHSALPLALGIGSPPRAPTPRTGGASTAPASGDTARVGAASGGELIAAVRAIDLPVTVSSSIPPSLDASIIFELYVPSISVFTFQCDTSAMSCFASILNPRSSILLLVREYTLQYGSILC